MTQRQQTGVWFIVTGILLLSLWVFAYAIINSLFSSGLILLDESKFTDESIYLIGASGVVSLQLASLTGVPFLITGLAQLITGKQTSKKSNKK
jgi:hypothetical protein